ncbi:MAG: hypothetical protein AAGH15_15935 [Myxococcota bacterium]
MSRERFRELMEEAVVGLPHDMKNVLRVVEDAEVDDESRILVAGSLLHVLSRGTAIPGVRGHLQHAGSVLLIRLALERACAESAEAMAKHREGAPDLFDALEEQLEVARAFLGEGMKLLEDTRGKLPKLNHEGHAAEACVRDDESVNWLYDAVIEAPVEIFEDHDEEDIQRELKGVEQIRKSLLRRLGR